MVFEPMHMNLREVVKKLGGVGLNIRAVKSFAKQMFTGLKHLKRCGILHGDIKPDNILVNEAMNQVKICDLGSADDLDKCEITPYLVSRFYRAPEIMLGQEYDEGVDMWSIGCVLAELFTGKILFNGNDNNHMLQLCQEFKGGFSKKKLKAAKFTSKHFDEEYRFKQKRVDKLTKAVLTDLVVFTKPTRDLHEVLKAASQDDSKVERLKIAQLADLLEKMFILDKDRRITVEQALQHEFIKDD